jgi:outer membrane protein assembly factor BamB
MTSERAGTDAGVNRRTVLTSLLVAGTTSGCLRTLTPSGEEANADVDERTGSPDDADTGDTERTSDGAEGGRSSWPLYQRDRSNSGQTSDISEFESPGFEWSFTDEDSGYGFKSPVVRDEVVYVPTGETLHAIRGSDGEPVWSAELDALGGVCAATDESVFLGDRKGYLVQFDRESGERRWETQPGGRIWYGPTADEGTLFVGSDTGIFVYDIDEQARKWTLQPEGNIPAPVPSPVVDRDAVYTTVEQTLFKLDRETGEQLWTYPFLERVQGPTALYGDRLITNLKTTVAAIDRRSGDQLWSRSLTEEYLSQSPAVTADMAVIGRPSGLVALDADTGDVRWTLETAAAAGSPLVLGDAVYSLTADGTLYGVSADGAQQFRKVAGSGGQTAIAATSTRLYVASGTELVALS